MGALNDSCPWYDLSNLLFYSLSFILSPPSPPLFLSPSIYLPFHFSLYLSLAQLIYLDFPVSKCNILSLYQVTLTYVIIIPNKRSTCVLIWYTYLCILIMFSSVIIFEISVIFMHVFFFNLNMSLFTTKKYFIANHLFLHVILSVFIKWL